MVFMSFAYIGHISKHIAFNQREYIAVIELDKAGILGIGLPRNQQNKRKINMNS